MLSSTGAAAAAAKPSAGPLNVALATVTVNEDPNIEVLLASKRIQKLTRATDALIARDFVLREEEAILDDLEAYIISLESEVRKAEFQTEELRSRSSLLRSGKRCAIAGENAELSALWNEYGSDMAHLVKRHSLRLAVLEKALATASTRNPESPVPKPLPPPPVAKT
ncbi:conserved hypothetical protein [Leishmania mexicana MHOM/GT/2001/U1103]|uniref:Uncharacterized protein n=1 Tax=Leishmania mexicana (strain MHOM/GT/2001/U1103) TaxID=929439 RepID=E9ATD0_LEIMU|nr:conserved hypothetical protein [Leishmania mexicana MHOM/GT/2001/U1103]CBZ26204.1 conserved hypothetical protein [Leishmania mexicana MHOM/GT/2001/U1103]